ncbi:carbohydrate ABC transporter substrate-binding protein, CUT1 family [Actinokineospora alba]|uniref:Carbohydrate ABC transporter substrate-binding protein, CUT1 family n=1 Tax=Actinokineospora alba TaxID=504798 RepID=A0A1H0L495_9PSEU|nr:extracellular solute-binding protein [Actinokineospora alba]TDP67199.1 alpha-glucoside transport system substrate-binding protein [Actinokineospora alba]SDJ04681.1 alpha-glucoside transport system substrate-binding protein [Actinokineospora alba]SDO63057.1 carbohydrate ABC transporter substrate-binding protein, CUT1 family [Actinokineospora alba]
MRLSKIAGLFALALAATACSPGESASVSATDGDGALKGQTVDIIGTWSGEEQARFEKVLAAFTAKTEAQVRYTGAGDELPTVVQTKVSGGTPPSVALVAQPGFAAQLAKSGAIKPVSAQVEQEVAANYASIWRKLGSFDNKLYGIYFKVANKSTIWYSKKAFEAASVPLDPPASWETFLTTSRSLADAGTSAVSVAGADGWTLTDWFENVYLRTAGPENYDKLTKHETPWTDQSVRVALRELAKLFGDQRLIEGGSSGALQTEFPKSVTNVFGDPGKAAMVFEGDFVSGVISSSTGAVVGRDATFFPFPSVNGSAPAVVTGGDMAVQFKDDKATNELMKFLASPEAGAVWAAEGGYLSASKGIDAKAYPDDVTRDLAQQIIDAGDNVRFDLSDLTPTAFGGTKGAGMWKDLQDFLADPTKVEETMQRLEMSAIKAYAS